MVTPHASEANFIAPGRRPLSAMSPTIVSLKKSGRLVAAAGASGGPLIITATTQTLARCVVRAYVLCDALPCALQAKTVPQQTIRPPLCCHMLSVV